ncbi:MAG: P-II family nitrogen regulator [Planctomycetota bacterium]
MLKKIECFIQPFKLEAVMNALIGLGVEGMSVLDAHGFGRQLGYGPEEHRQNTEPIKFREKKKVEIVVDEEIVDDVIRLIRKLAYTGTMGAGKVFVLPVEDAIRISTDEKGRSAIE